MMSLEGAIGFSLSHSANTIADKECQIDLHQYVILGHCTYGLNCDFTTSSEMRAVAVCMSDASSV